MSEAKAKKGSAMVDYLQDSVQELKKVTWPTRNQAVRLTLLVLGFCIAAAVVIGVIDGLFGFGHQKLVDYASSLYPVDYVSDTADPASTATTIPVTATADSSATTVTPVTTTTTTQQ